MGTSICRWMWVVMIVLLVVYIHLLKTLGDPVDPRARARPAIW